MTSFIQMTSLFQSAVPQDPSENILICWYVLKKYLLYIVYVKNSCAAYCFWKKSYIFKNPLINRKIKRTFICKRDLWKMIIAFLSLLISSMLLCWIQELYIQILCYWSFNCRPNVVLVNVGVKTSNYASKVRFGNLLYLLAEFLSWKVSLK